MVFQCINIRQVAWEVLKTMFDPYIILLWCFTDKVNDTYADQIYSFVTWKCFRFEGEILSQ